MRWPQSIQDCSFVLIYHAPFVASAFAEKIPNKASEPIPARLEFQFFHDYFSP